MFGSPPPKTGFRCGVIGYVLVDFVLHHRVFYCCAASSAWPWAPGALDGGGKTGHQSVSLSGQAHDETVSYPAVAPRERGRRRRIRGDSAQGWITPPRQPPHPPRSAAA